MKATAALGVLVLLLLASPAISQVPDDKLIVPGQRIGKWTLEMTIDDLLRLNGPRNAGGRPTVERVTTADAPPNLWFHHWDNVGLVVITIGRETQSIGQIIIESGEYRTDKGVGTGSSREAILAAFGPPTFATRPLLGFWSPVYDEIGLAFDVNQNDIAMTTSVFRKGTANQLYKH